ncbi:MAG: hypothetical protein K2H60_12420 [Muribaculaceae bacterium]|nr:hypothetical protein [Muribaculaceae bacterium]
MTDLSTMMTSMSLSDCKEEIDRQFATISEHDNEMKMAILYSFLLQGALEALEKLDSRKFLSSLRNELNRLVKRGEEISLSKEMYIEHFEKNRDIIVAFENSSNKVKKLNGDIETLLSDYDNLIKQLGTERCRKSIAEIEAELNRSNP